MSCLFLTTRLTGGKYKFNGSFTQETIAGVSCWWNAAENICFVHGLALNDAPDIFVKGSIVPEAIVGFLAKVEAIVKKYAKPGENCVFAVHWGALPEPNSIQLTDELRKLSKTFLCPLSYWSSMAGDNKDEEYVEEFAAGAFTHKEVFLKTLQTRSVAPSAGILLRNIRYEIGSIFLPIDIDLQAIEILYARDAKVAREQALACFKAAFGTNAATVIESRLQRARDKIKSLEEKTKLADTMGLLEKTGKLQPLIMKTEELSVRPETEWVEMLLNADGPKLFHEWFVKLMKSLD